MALNNTKIFVSPLTKETYLCTVNTKNIITARRKLDDDEKFNFIAGCVAGLEDKYGNAFEFGDDKIKIKIEIKNLEK